MNISDLKIFCCVAAEGGITRAAKRLHRVPSNVTTRIRQLEDDLKIQLFLREGKRITITPAGTVLLGYAIRILSLVEEAREELHDCKPGGHMRLGSMEIAAATRLPEPLTEFHFRYPEVTLELSIGSTQKLVEQVLCGELDAAFVVGPIHNERLESKIAFIERLVLVSNAEHPTIRSPKDLSRPTMLAFATGCTYRYRLEKWFSQADLEPERVVELNSYHAILSCAMVGMGVALLPLRTLEIFHDSARLCVHEMPSPLQNAETVLIWRKGAKPANITALADLINDDSVKNTNITSS